MQRRTFAFGALASGLLPRPARATGGADIEGEVTLHTVRILLASGSSIPSARAIDAWHFAWNGRTYRGTYRSTVLPDGRAALVNIVPLDAYLYGVVSKEVSPAWPRASQHAQAIVARSYALCKLRPDRPYDVVAGAGDQWYGGIEAETVEGRDAVDATEGTVVSFGGRVARVAYASCCGGHTADGFALWGMNVPYLQGVADPYCASSPYYAWTAMLTQGELDRAFAVAGVRAVSLLDPDSSGRPGAIGLIGERTVDVRASEFRVAMGESRVRSTLIRAAQSSPGGIELYGHGYGHGVGMCQWGARALGKLGAGTATIVAFYFPQTGLGSA